MRGDDRAGGPRPRSRCAGAGAASATSPGRSPGQQLEQFCRAAARTAPARCCWTRTCCSTTRPRRRLRGAGRARGQPGRAAAGLLGRLRRRRGVPAADPRPGQPAPTWPSASSGTYYGLAWAADSAVAVLRRHRRGVPAARGLAARARHRARRRTCWCTARTTSGSSSSCGPPAAAAYVLIETAVPGHHRDAGHPGGRRRRSAAVAAEPRTAGHGVPRRSRRRAGRRASSTWSPTTGRPSSGWSGRRSRRRARPRAERLDRGHRAAPPDTRLVSCDVFGRYLVVEQRHGAATQLRVLDRETGEQRLIEAGGPERGAGPGGQRGLRARPR